MLNTGQEVHKYDLVSRWVKEKIVTIEIDGKPDFKVATPLDFWPDSPSALISPEDLFVASAASCYGVSLSGVAARFHAEFTAFTIEATGTLKKGENGWEFDKITISPRILVPTQKDKEQMEKAAERAHQYCVVSNSMKCPVDLKYEIVIAN